MGRQKILTGWKRVLNLQQVLRDKCLSGCLVHRPENIYYFTSVYPQEPSFFILPLTGDPELVAARAVYPHAQKDSLIPVIPGDTDIARSAYERMLARDVLKKPPGTVLKSALRRIWESPIGVELDYLSAGLFQYFHIRNHMDIAGDILDMRSIKDSFEIEFISRACSIADQAMDHARQRIVRGMPEKEVSGIFDAQAKVLGAEESRCIVRSGKNTSLAGSGWMNGALEKGPLLVNYGARVKGYWSDLMRMFYLGSEPDSFFLDNYLLVLKARNKALERMNPGESIYGPDSIIRQTFQEKGLEQNMIFAAGHGIGLESHEPPLLGQPPQNSTEQEESATLKEEARMASMLSALYGSRDSDAGQSFQKGQVLALEPGLYFPQLGICIKDMVCIREKPELLSALSVAPEDLTVPL